MGSWVVPAVVEVGPVPDHPHGEHQLAGGMGGVVEASLRVSVLARVDGVDVAQGGVEQAANRDALAPVVYVVLDGPERQHERRLGEEL